MREMTRRYVLFRVICNSKVTDQQFHETLVHSIRRHFGEIGFSRIDPKIIEFNPESLTGIVSCDRAACSELESAMALITKYLETPLTVLSLRISGTVRGARYGSRK
jgi:RNase P/RNase MRP subunit POP5